MPAFYAHHRFGNQVFDLLDGELHDIIAKHYTQFQIGLQGPDIFFFYKPYSTGNRVAKYGHQLHSSSAYPFFKKAISVIREKGRHSAEYAYLMGYICHFVLDSESHPYVNNMVTRINVSHLEIEEEFEKFLLRKDGIDPFSFAISSLIPSDNFTAKTIYPFYEHIDPVTAKKALQDLRTYKKFLNNTGKLQQLTIHAGIKILKKEEDYKGVMLQRKDNPACQQSSAGLNRRFKTSLTLAADLIQDFDKTVLTGKALNRRFNWTFE